MGTHGGQPPIHRTGYGERGEWIDSQNPSSTLYGGTPLPEQRGNNGLGAAPPSETWPAHFIFLSKQKGNIICECGGDGVSVGEVYFIDP